MYLTTPAILVLQQFCNRLGKKASETTQKHIRQNSEAMGAMNLRCIMGWIIELVISRHFHCQGPGVKIEKKEPANLRLRLKSASRNLT